MYKKYIVLFFNLENIFWGNIIHISFAFIHIII